MKVNEIIMPKLKLLLNCDKKNNTDAYFCAISLNFQNESFLFQP